MAALTLTLVGGPTMPIERTDSAWPPIPPSTLPASTS